MRACLCFCAAGRASDHRAANLAPARTRPPSWRDRKASGFAPLRQAANVWNKGPGEVRQAYDLVLNTAAMSVTAGVEQVTQIAHSPRHQPTAASQKIVAGLLQQAQDWREGLCDFANPNASCVLHVEVRCERLRLNGITSSEDAIARIEQRPRGKSPAARIPWPQSPWRM